MVRTFLVAALVAVLTGLPGGAAPPPADAPGVEAPAPGKAKSGAAHVVSTLHDTRVAYEKDLKTTPLSEVLADLSKRYAITFVINPDAFPDGGVMSGEAKATRLPPARLDGMTLGSFLSVYLRGLSAPDVTYLVRDDRVEITSRTAARKEAGLDEAVAEAKGSNDPAEVARAKARLNLPLVCVAADNKPLGDVLTEMARVYGLNIVLDRAARDAAKTPLTVQLLNVPADTALQLLAGQAGMEVVRKGNTFTVVFGGGA